MIISVFGPAGTNLNFLIPGNPHAIFGELPEVPCVLPLQELLLVSFIAIWLFPTAVSLACLSYGVPFSKGEGQSPGYKKAKFCKYYYGSALNECVDLCPPGTALVSLEPESLGIVQYMDPGQQTHASV